MRSQAAPGAKESPPAASFLQSGRRRRLQEIANHFTQDVYDEKARVQLDGSEPVSRYVAVTSEGSAESMHLSNGNLRVSDTIAEMSDILALEASRGWVTHGRIWDLEDEWNLWGNLKANYSTEIEALNP